MAFLVPTPLTLIFCVILFFLSLPKLASRCLAFKACDDSEFGMFIEHSQSALRLWRASLGCLDSFLGWDQFLQLS